MRMISIHVNGREESIDGGLSVTGLLDHLGLAGKRVAVELNREIVPRSQHGETRVQAGDKVEIVRAIGGG
jgi:sulfur carrier protein